MCGTPPVRGCVPGCMCVVDMEKHLWLLLGRVDGRRSDWETSTTGSHEHQPKSKEAERRTRETGQDWKGGQNLQEEKEAVLRSRVQMVVITRTGAVGVAGEDEEQMAEMLRGMVTTASVLLSQKEGDVG